MSFHTTKSGCMISSIATQKEIVSFLAEFYPITKKAVTDFIKASREKKYSSTFAIFQNPFYTCVIYTLG